MPNKITERLSQLDPALREKVETQLLTEIEKSVAASTLANSSAAAGAFDRQHDRGPLFGKDFDRQGAHGIDEMKEIAQLDDAQFQRFAQRLTTLRGGGN